ncbi:Crp/Fnr family transcriptional regulator [Nocardiopsis dassonvillei]|uniref:Crp/Fnr family transcriptional regulator n=1 Tax=Nocardiopsis dassonvillei TaxID=2014 RepID=UPI003404AE80
MNLRETISPTAWNELVLGGVRRTFAPGVPLMRQGESSTFAIALTEGTVKITQDTIDGRQVPLALRGPGELLGEMGVLLNEPRSASVWSITRCVGHTISAPTFRSLVERCDLHGDIYRRSVTRSLQGERYLRNLLCHAPDVRMARFLAELANEVGEPRAGTMIIHMGMDREELGFMLKMSRATASEALRRLKSLKLIEIGRKTIKVINQVELESYEPQKMRDVS